jgi:methylenetetrahydrofolate dehydrogenase (NADP+)/methenyltetrahydrofolate cyclohydrolase
MIIDGKALAQEVIEGLKAEREKMNFPISLAVVAVLKDGAGLSFIRQKEKVARELDIKFISHQYPVTLKSKELRKRIVDLAKNGQIKGIVVQLPLPENFNQPMVLNAIPPEKDPDVLTEKNLGAFYLNRLTILPPVVRSIKYLIERYQITLRGQNVLIIGQGPLVGKPLALWFINQKATAISANSRTQNLKELTLKADIIVSGAGEPDLIKKEMVKEGVIIFDAGLVTEKGTLKGDVSVEVRDKAALVTPVPGGLGPLVVAMLYRNLFDLIQLGPKGR